MDSMNRIPMAVAVVIGALVSTTALAVRPNEPPPPNAILDLGGSQTNTPAVPVNLVTGSSGFLDVPPALASVDFTASSAGTDIELALRDDPAGVFVWDVAVKDLTNPGASTLLTNGNFANGLSSWTVFDSPLANGNINPFTGCGSYAGLSTTCMVAGNGNAYNTIDQTIRTTVGDKYQLSFYYGAALGDPPVGAGSGFYQDLSTSNTNGGNAIDILAYANPVSVSAPEIDPASAASALGLLAGGLMVLRGRKRSA